AQLEWHGIALNRPDWSDDSHAIAFTVSRFRGRFTIHAMLNAYWEPLIFELPLNGTHTKRRWRRWINTALQSPDDICDWDAAPLVSQRMYEVAPRSLVLLVEPVE